MTKRLLSLSAVLLLLAIVGKFFAKPLWAQARAALVADIDTPARAPYQHWIAVTCTAGADFCIGTAPQVPAGKRLTITNIAGEFSVVSQAGQLVLVTLQHNSQSSFGGPAYAAPVSLPTFFQGTVRGGDYFVVNAPVLAHFDPPDFPYILLGLGANNAGGPMSFALSGYVVDCTVAPCAPITF